MTAARWVDPALGFAVSAWIHGLTSGFFFLILERSRLDGYNPSIHLVRIQLLTLPPSEQSELLLRAPSHHFSLLRDAN